MRSSVIHRISCIGAAALFGAPAVLLGQQPTPPAPAPAPAPAAAAAFATVTGAVIDSVHGSVPLEGATIRVEGANRQGRTGADGQFRIDSIPPGEYSLTLLHPLLDTLNIQIATRAARFEAGQLLTVELAIPSQTRVIELSCTQAWRNRGPAALVGKVLDADTDSALVGAKVSLVWEELSLTDLKRVPRVREGTVGKDGSYRICGLPSGLAGTVQASWQDRKTAVVSIKIDEVNPLAFQTLRIGKSVVVAAAPADSGARPAGAPPADSVQRIKGPARLSGRVLNAAGAPVANARVEVQGTGAIALTRPDGTFSLSELPSGTQSLVTRQLGFEPVEMAVELSGRQPRQVTVTMSKPARVLEAVAVTAEKDAPGLDKVGFTQRQRSGFGYFLSPEDIENRNATRMTDLFRAVPSLRVVPSGMDYVIESARDATGGCVRYVVDGAPYQAMFAGDIDRLMPPHDVAAIEVYQGSNTPAEFQAPGGSACTTVVMWSRFRVRRDR